ncbi:16S rRNA (cytidine(1402)-2'-O)-methyltransferase [Johnsonella ignava]|uniref:16S rRNA (cytidine(1402)-2'-O)-methyltransferase n=1 Tax=Johnsonella ignava TaxID=43995 RepID=UPI0023F2E281|nr:16S rRNA (cytidine(1402)-2'-O)-methyltransferase [Johnsonella ignava]
MDINIKKYGMIYAVATPIGNLADISLRALEVLRTVDFIACEDTRNTLKLLNHYNIHKPLTSYHKYNRIKKAYDIIKEVKKGKYAAFVTDAGMPAVSDPGEDLIRIAAQEKVAVSIIPGPSACLSALALSTFKTGNFVFEGFIPSEKKDRIKVLERLKTEERTIIVYEAPHRLLKTLNVLKGIFGENRRINLVRELTKKHEETLLTNFKDIISDCENGNYIPRGEYVLVIEGRPEEEAIAERSLQWERIDIALHVKMYEDSGMDRKAAIKQAAKDRGISKREVYNNLLNDA